MKYYPSPAKIEELFKEGDLIDLERKIDKCLYCKDDIDAWGRIVPEEHRSLAILFSRYINKVDYIYIYRSGKWYCHDCKE